MSSLDIFEEYPDRLCEVFTDKTLLLTGGTGFVGKVFVEKVLRTCPKLKKIYLLVRTKKDKDPNERMTEIFNGPLFELLRKQRGEEVLKKVVTIPADMEAVDLALAPEDRARLAREVEMIYHSAATVRFDESLKKAVFLNTRGTKLMLELAKECKKLKLFAHISTAYCHSNERVLYEKAYPPPANPHNIIQMCEMLDGDILDSITDKILGSIPNTYTFTKALSEGLVNDEMDNLPVVILRPSVIVPVWQEPLPGWTDNLNGPLGLLIGAGKGVIRTMYCNKETYIDYMPVDIVANCIIFTSFIYFNSGCRKRIFNLTTSSEHQISFEKIIKMGREIVETKLPFNGVLWYPGGSVTRSRFLHNIVFLLFQVVPAIVLDALLVLLGYKPVLMRVQKRIFKGYSLLEYYANNQWDFNNEELLEIRKTLNPRERATYKLDGDGMDFYDYFTKCVHASRLYILKERDETIPSAKRHMKVMWLADRLFKTLFVLGFIYLLYKYVVSPVLF